MKNFNALYTMIETVYADVSSKIKTLEVFKFNESVPPILRTVWSFPNN